MSVSTWWETTGLPGKGRLRAEGLRGRKGRDHPRSDETVVQSFSFPAAVCHVAEDFLSRGVPMLTPPPPPPPPSPPPEQMGRIQEQVMHGDAQRKGDQQMVSAVSLDLEGKIAAAEADILKRTMDMVESRNKELQRRWDDMEDRVAGQIDSMAASDEEKFNHILKVAALSPTVSRTTAVFSQSSDRTIISYTFFFFGGGGGGEERRQETRAAFCCGHCSHCVSHGRGGMELARCERGTGTDGILC